MGWFAAQESIFTGMHTEQENIFWSESKLSNNLLLNVNCKDVLRFQSNIYDRFFCGENTLAAKSR